MATGGMPYSKKESKQRSNWQRSTSYSDRDDAHSLNSVPNDVRINNWDFSDWRPNSQSVDVKRRKKSKGNPEREREQSLSLDSPPQDGPEKKQRTPSTFPRTKITPTTPTTQRVALENLRQQLTFSDDQCSTDGEPNNERVMNTRHHPSSNYSRPDSSSQTGSSQPKARGQGRADAGTREVRSNRNNNRDDTTREIGPDSNQIVGRLMQIRDYIKQAGSMMGNLKQSRDPKTCKEDMEKLKTLIDNLKEQERGYMGLLQRTLAMREENGVLENGGAEADGGVDGKRDSDDSVSVELDVDTDASETTENTQSSSSRPRIEDKLGADSDDESGESNTSRGDSENMDNTVIPGRSVRQMDWQPMEETTQEQADQDQVVIQGELESLRRQEELLKILVEKQEQLKMLQDRHETLLSMKDNCEKKLALAQAKERSVVEPETFMTSMSGSAAPPSQDSESKSNIVGYPESETEDDNNPEIMPKELVELSRHLSMLKNQLKTETSAEEGNSAQLSAMVSQEALLQDKLVDLQEKKQRMDSLLRQLQGLRSHRLDLLLNNETDLTEGASEPPQAPESVAAVAEMAQTFGSSQQEAEKLMEAQNKLGKLQEVRDRLNQLRDLVSYYQSVKGDGGDNGEGDERLSAPAYSDYGPDMDSQAVLQQLRQQLGPDLSSLQDGRLLLGAAPPLVNLPPGPAAEEHSDEENASDSESNGESQLSSLGPWGDDPEIQEKVQKLRAAKEKLRQLQDIVARVQQSPGGVADLSETMTELVGASEEGEIVSQATHNNDHNISVSEGEVPTQDKDDREDGQDLDSIQRQREELEGLREERERLRAVQTALQNLQDQFHLSQEDSEDRRPKKHKDGRGLSQPSNTPVVTFASNDELYSKMRKQRILREELRQKKKELEAIMRKDRNKKQYFRNQDNHSDTVSYSTDAFAMSASADATMATWGGSTVDGNLGSITEDEDGNDRDAAQEDDDGYPSDGIVQVEEEEEENDSDGTYTIEEDARQRRSERPLQEHRLGARPKVAKGAGQGFPRPMRKQDVTDGTRPKQSSKPLKKKTKQGKRSGGRVKQENYRSAEEIVQEVEQSGGGLGVLQQQLERTSQMCQALLLDQQNLLSPAAAAQSMMSPSGFGMPMRGPGMMPDMFQQQLQQQQLMLCLNQCYQQLSLQQGEMQSIQQQLHALTLQVADSAHHQNADTGEESRPSPGQTSRLTTPMTTSFSTLPNSTSASFNMHASRPTSFTLNPHFPSTFPYLNQPPGRQSTYSLEAAVRDETKLRMDRQNAGSETHINNLRPIPPPRVDSYLQSAGRGYLNQQQPSQTGAMRLDKQTESSANNRAPRLNLQDMMNTRKMKQRADTVEGVQRYSTPTSQSGGDATGPRQGSGYRPGLSAGISGAGFQDATSLSSILSARLMSDAGQPRSARDGETGDLSLFEALRETIYSEVATLISQNESRPHFLIELFRILQILSSDYLRQRGLYAIQDLVSKTLKEDNTDSFAAPPPPWLTATAGNCTPSELTPSESLATSDDEEVKARQRERMALMQMRERAGLLLTTSGSLKNDDFDYAEKVENTSSLSTPSNSLWDSPFAQESLGDTVIHFDKALEKMREFERMKAENEKSRVSDSDPSPTRRDERTSNISQHAQAVAASMDQGSESSVSDMPYPRIDTNQLDHQIKSIMTEIIPVIKEHMEDMCSPQLLAYIKRLVLSLTRQHDNGQEFARFFHRQLGSILQDSMAKFEGRKMRECGEEILVDMSEVLFNELAFFRLMQDLDEPTIVNKIRTNTWFQSVSEKSAPSSKKMAVLVGEESDGNGSSSGQTDDDQIPSTLRMTATEEEDLGKDRDDELASEMPIQDAEEKDDDPESPYKAGGGLQIELAVSETKPFTRIGSDEDEDDADESQSMEDPSETAVSRDSKLEHAQPVQESGGKQDQDRDTEEVKVTEPAEVTENEDMQQQQQAETSEADGTVTGQTTPEKVAEAMEDTPEELIPQVNGEVHMNGDIDIEEITLEDLPGSLTIGGPADLEERIEEEQKLTSGAASVMVTMETSIELVGDGDALKDPESSA